jgi:hypothetical protein
MFGRFGVTPGGFPREQRLLTTRAMLADPRRAGRTAAALGSAVDMDEPRTFERAFRRQLDKMLPSGGAHRAKADSRAAHQANRLEGKPTKRTDSRAARRAMADSKPLTTNSRPQATHQATADPTPLIKRQLTPGRFNERRPNPRR